MKLFTTLAALTLIAAPAHAASVTGLVSVARLQFNNEDYARACKTITLASKEASKQKYPTARQKSLKELATNTCKFAKESEDLESLKQKAHNPIKQACTAKWGTDYVMVKHCFDQQTKAKTSLGL